MEPHWVRLYLVTDPRYCPAPRLLELAPALALAGVSMIQVREKDTSARELIEITRSLVARVRPLGVPVIVNDRADVAVAAEADGVHLGRSDLPLTSARAILGPDAIIGASVESVDEPGLAEFETADYLAVSPVFQTPTKLDTTTPLGLEGVAAVASRSRVPVVGIGGIGSDEAASVIGAGAEGVAVISAILASPDPIASAKTLRSVVDAAFRARSDR